MQLWQVLISIVLAVIVGSFTGPEGRIAGYKLCLVYAYIGQIFLNALTLLVVPLVASSIINGLSQLGQNQSFGRLSAKTFFFYIFTTLLAALTGLAMFNIFQPGVNYVQAGNTVLQSLELSNTAPHTHMEALGLIIQKIVPSNIFRAASEGNMLGIIFFSLLFGFSVAKIKDDTAKTLRGVCKSLFMTFMHMTHLLVKVLPIGVFFLVAKVVAEQGTQSIGSLINFFFTVVVGLAIFLFVVIPSLLLILGLNPLKHFKAMMPALVTAFSSSSSTATLPVTMECVEKRAGVSNHICSFVIPLGTSVNMSGSALYECIAALFIAQVYGFELGLVQQLVIVFLSLLTSMGVAGIPSGSLVSLLIILNAIGLPTEALALIIPVDRMLDMCRTTVNVFSDASCAVLVAHTEGEKILQN
jgi:proton glutamate symport protein